MDLYSLPLGAPPLGECPKDKGGAASGEEKVSTNGRRMRGLPLLLMSDSVWLNDYREVRKCPALFVKMILWISKPLIRPICLGQIAHLFLAGTATLLGFAHFP